MRILLIAVLLACAPAQAVDFANPNWKWVLPGDAQPPRQFTFNALDTDRDLALTPGEAEASGLVGRNFERADLDADGRLSPIEFNNLALALSVPPDPFPLD
jgi:hypothetical protein